MTSAKDFSHLNASGQARMVDVGSKSPTMREACAQGYVHMSAATLRKLADHRLPKGDVLATARIAGIQAAKRCAELIPLCHTLPLDSAELKLHLLPERLCLRIEAICRTHARTGVEMEALCAVSVAALTVYDMCKSMEPGMRIDAICVLRKSGGSSGDWHAEADEPHG